MTYFLLYRPARAVPNPNIEGVTNCSILFSRSCRLAIVAPRVPELGASASLSLTSHRSNLSLLPNELVRHPRGYFNTNKSRSSRWHRMLPDVPPPRHLEFWPYSQPFPLSFSLNTLRVINGHRLNHKSFSVFILPTSRVHVSDLDSKEQPIITHSLNRWAFHVSIVALVGQIPG